MCSAMRSKSHRAGGIRLAGFAAFAACLAGLTVALAAGGFPAGDRLTLNFNPDWKFLKADPANGAASPSFDDRAWTDVSLPHTYNDVDTFDDWSLLGHRGEQNQWGGRTWYRKTFSLPESVQTGRFTSSLKLCARSPTCISTDISLAVSKNGFAPFGFDLTPQLRFGAANVLAVMCDNRFMKDPLGNEPGAKAGSRDRRQQAWSGFEHRSAGQSDPGRAFRKGERSHPRGCGQDPADQIPWNNPHWHPAHGGIYRNVRLYVVDPLHISLPLYSFLQTAGPYVYATRISGESVRICLEVPILNGREIPADVELRAEVLDPDGKPVLALQRNGRIADRRQRAVRGRRYPSKSSAVGAGLSISVPRGLHPACNGGTVDSCEIPLGIRFARWDAEAPVSTSTAATSNSTAGAKNRPTNGPAWGPPSRTGCTSSPWS